MVKKASKAFLKKLEIAACTPHNGRGPTKREKLSDLVSDEPVVVKDGEFLALWGFEE